MNGTLVACWESGFESLYKGVDAQKVYEEILSIGHSATPDEMVELGKDPEKEIHKCFTWDDTEAAKKWRKEEARQITHHLRFRTVSQTPEQEPSRIFVKADETVGYRSVEFVIKNDDEYHQLIARALGELRAFQKKYAFLSDREELIALINAVSALEEST